MIIRNLLFIFLFFSKIFVVKCTDDPIKEGRYCVFDEGNFNVGFLEEVKNYLKENKEEIFYLFQVEKAYLMDFNKDIKEQKTEENIIYYSKCKFGSELFNLYVNPKNFVENTENCRYINITKGKLEVKKYVSMHTLEGEEVYNELNCLSVLDKGDIAKNSKNDQPLIFELKFHDGTKKSYFCSNIGIISEYLSRKSKKLSLFKNDNIEGFKAVLFLKVKNYFDNMFYDCNKIEMINIDKKFDCADDNIDPDILYIDGDSLFENCVNAKIINLGPSIGNTKKSNFVFKNCKCLKDLLIIGENFKIGDYALENCEKVKKLEYVNFNGGVTLRKDIVISTGCSKNCSSLNLIECLNYNGKENVNISIDGDPKELFYGCKNLKIPKIIINLNNKDEDFSFINMFYGVSKMYNDKIILQFNRNNEDDRIPDFNYDNVFNGCDVEKKDIIVKTLDKKEIVLENITKDDKIKWFIVFPDNYIKLRDIYQDAYDSTLLSYLNSKFESNQSKEEIEKEYNEFKKQHEENHKITDQKIEEVNVDKNLGTYGKCGLCFSKCCCCCCNKPS